MVKKHQLQEVWDWLFENLDPDKTTILTRGATWERFKSIQKDSGLDFDLLKRYGLEDAVVSGGASKQDFHAKFFAGMSADQVEVLSGSANLVRGPSIENITFNRMSFDRFNSKYLEVMKYKKMPKLKKPRAGLVIKYDGKEWFETYYNHQPWWS